MYKAVFLDRDGTIIKDEGYLSDSSQVIFYGFTFEALNLLRPYYRLFIVSNQSGISKGIVSKEQVDSVNEYIVRELLLRGIEISRVYYCPHIDEENCACKKPSPFFLKQAEAEYGIDLSESYMIGDHPADVLCAANAGAHGIYVLSGHGEKHRHEINSDYPVKENLLEAAEYILQINQSV